MAGQSLIDRAFRTLSAEDAYKENARNIRLWKEHGLLSFDEALCLEEYNYEQYIRRYALRERSLLSC